MSPNPTSDLEASAVNLSPTEPLPQKTNAATDRILELEIELAKLRQQLAAIVRVQEQGAAAGKNSFNLRSRLFYKENQSNTF